MFNDFISMVLNALVDSFHFELHTLLDVRWLCKNFAFIYCLSVCL